jgi:hypothetical protein
LRSAQFFGRLITLCVILPYNITLKVLIFKAAITAVVATKKVAPTGIGLTADLLELIDAQRGDLSRSLFVRRIIQEYYQPTEQQKKSTESGPTRFVSVPQKPSTKVVRNQTITKSKAKNDS